MLPANVEIGWQDYIQIFMRRKWFFIVPVIVIVVITTVVSGTLPKIYRAQTTILVEEEKIQNPLMQGLSVSTSMGQRLQSIREELLSWRSMVALIRKIKLLPEDVSPMRLENYVNKELRKNIDIRPRSKSIVLIAY